MEENTVETEASKQPGVETFVTSASKEKDARKITLTYDLGRDLDAAAEIHGKEVVYGMYAKSMKIAIQANVRTRLEAVNEDGTPKYTDEQIDAFVQNEYKPGVRQARVGGEASTEKLVSKLLKQGITTEKLLEMIAAAQAAPTSAAE